MHQFTFREWRGRTISTSSKGTHSKTKTTSKMVKNVMNHGIP
jgi:hypothetical protein